MADKILFKSTDSAMIVKDGKLYIVKTEGKGYSPLAISIMPGFQIELGRTIKELNQALSFTRIPVVIKISQQSPKVRFYQIIRMKTGIVDDKIVATIAVDNNTDKIISITFNRELINDKNYRKHNNLSVFHQLALPYNLNGCGSRSEQVKLYIKTILPLYEKDIQVKENDKIINATIKVSDKDNIIIAFIHNRNKGKFELTTITLKQ